MERPVGTAGILGYNDICGKCRVAAALVRGFGHHCTVFRSLRSGTPVTANLRKRNMRTGPEQPYSSSVGGDVGRHHVMGIVVKSQQCATQELCGGTATDWFPLVLGLILCSRLRQKPACGKCIVAARCWGLCEAPATR